MRLRELLCGVAVCVLAAGCATRADNSVSGNMAAEPVRNVHERLLVLDTHLDTPAHLARSGWNVMERHSYEGDFSQVDYPRMVKGGLDGGFWVIYTPQGERSPQADAANHFFGLQRANAILGMVKANPDHFELALKAEDAERIHAEGKRVVYISIENASPLSGRENALQEFYDLGVRMMGFVHTRNNDIADSATDEPEWGGLSEQGRSLVEQANRLGVVLDASHASDQVLEQLIDLSATPVILSHSGPAGVYAHPRNVRDDLLLRLAQSGGVLQVNALGAYLKDLPPSPPERAQAFRDLRAEFGGRSSDEMEPEEQARYMARFAEINRDYPSPQADFEDFMEHLLYAIKLLGVDHVGIGADWDGGGGVAGMSDVSALPKITERLLAEGYTESDLAKIWGGNALRLLREAEIHAASLNHSQN